MAEAALRSLEADDFGSALRRLEAEAKGPELGGLARQCLGALARDASPAVSRPALCAIACAVHDENKEVRLWARSEQDVDKRFSWSLQCFFMHFHAFS